MNKLDHEIYNNKTKHVSTTYSWNDFLTTLILYQPIANEEPKEIIPLIPQHYYKIFFLST